MNYQPPTDLAIAPEKMPVVREMGVCPLQFAGWGQRQFYQHLAAYRYRGVQIFKAAELALHKNHFDYKALTDGTMRQEALDYLMETMAITNHTPSEVSGHASLMALLCPRGVIHRGFEEFLPDGVWVEASDGEPDVKEIQKRTLEAAGKIFEACVYAKVPVFNMFGGSGRVGKELVQFPHLGGAERAEIIGKDLEILRKLAEIAIQAGMEEVNTENHREQLFHTPEEMLEFALLFINDPLLRIMGCKSDMSHLHFTGCYAPDVIRYVTNGLKNAQALHNARLIGIGEGKDMQRADGMSTEADLARATAAQARLWDFFRRMHAKYGPFRLGGVQSTHSQSPLSNADGMRPNRFGAVDLGGAQLWRETMFAYNQPHGLPRKAQIMIENEDDSEVGLTPGTMDIRLNGVFRVGEFVYDYMCTANPMATHQELMK